MRSRNAKRFSAAAQRTLRPAYSIPLVGRGAMECFAPIWPRARTIQDVTKGWEWARSECQGPGGALNWTRSTGIGKCDTTKS